MPTTINLLSKQDSLRVTDDLDRIVPVASYSTGWVAQNCVTTVISTDLLVDSRYVLRLAPSSAGEITLTLADVPLKFDEFAKTLSFNARAKSRLGLDVSVHLYVDDESEENEPHSQSFSGGLYNAIQSNRATIPADLDEHTVTIVIKFNNHYGNTIFFTAPHLIDDFAIFNNWFVQEMNQFIPDFYLDLEASRAQPSYPFYRLIDILTSSADDSRKELDAIFEFESEEVSSQDDKSLYWGQSSLTSPSRVRPEYVPWLSQFTGREIHRNFVYEGNLYYDNKSLERDFIEWQLRNSFYGRAAGTRGAMIEAGKQVLIKTKDNEESSRSIAITANYQGDPFALRVQTLTNETIDASNGEESAIVLKSVNMARPMGYTVSHVTVDEFFLTLDDLTLGVLGEHRLQ